MGKTRRNVLYNTLIAAGILTAAETVAASENGWNSRRVYRDGDEVSHAGYRWEAHWYTRGEEPSDTVAVWNRIGQLPGTNEYPPWTPEGVYRAGNRVTHAGYRWEARWWTEGEEPSTDPSGPWTQLDTVDSGEESKTEDDETETMNETPVERHGQLQVIDTNLCDASGEPVQLRGMSTHGIQWFGWDEFLTEGALDALADDWEAELCRVAMYVQEGGYETDPDGFTEEVSRIVEAVTDRGMYAIIDFHVHQPGDPLENLDNAKRFFETIAAEHAEKDNIIYEICNEPNGVGWDSIKTYAEDVIPSIRRHDPESPIVVGTRGWSSLGFADIGPDGPREIIENPVDGENLLYAYHFYAATHGEWERDQLAAAAEELPIFVTECGSMEATGDGESDFESTRAFMDVLADNNISWAFWSYSDDWRTSGIWAEGTTDGSWTVENLTPTGEWVRSEILER